MSITPIGGSTPDWAQVNGVGQRDESGRGERVLSSVADRLGTTVEDLKTQLSGGKSLADVAAAQGVSHDDLVSAIKAGLQNGGPSSTAGSSSSTSSSDLDAVANRIADRVHHAHGHHGHHGHRAAATTDTATTASTVTAPATDAAAQPGVDVRM